MYGRIFKGGNKNDNTAEWDIISISCILYTILFVLFVEDYEVVVRFVIRYCKLVLNMI